jgi:hypothetical protein
VALERTPATLAAGSGVQRFARKRRAKCGLSRYVKSNRRKFAAKLLAVDAVCFEPISASKLPDNRENTGNFAEVWLILRKLAR